LLYQESGFLTTVGIN